MFVYRSLGAARILLGATAALAIPMAVLAAAVLFSPAPAAAAQIAPDQDGDGVDTATDNCPDTFNPDQTDADGDGIGDACDSFPSDFDNDGVAAGDNCPTTPNPDQLDGDRDGIGDVCDDTDSDGVFDAVDNCPGVSNRDQADSDGDHIGDACELFDAPKPTSLRPLIAGVLANLNQLSFGQTPVVGLAADCLSQRGTVEVLLAAMDQDGDGMMTWEEVLGADLPALARELAPMLRCQAPDAQSGDDPILLDLLSTYETSMRTGLGDAIGGDVRVFSLPMLRLDAQRTLRYAAFERLSDLVALLDARPGEGDLVGLDFAVNLSEHAALMERLDRLFPLAYMGDARRLRRGLLELRALADGDSAVPDVIGPRAAPQILFAIDGLLSLPGE